jgi:hypothetical protein
MRLHRRDPSVRARLQRGDLSITSAAQLETAFAGAERQSRTIRNLAGCGEPDSPTLHAPGADGLFRATVRRPLRKRKATGVALRAAALAPESTPNRSGADLSAATRSSAPLLHPQRQRELIEQATGMSTRQVAGLLAAAGPDVAPTLDTLRIAASNRYTLKVTIDQECEQGLRQLKDLLSHLDPRMSWGTLVARLVREALDRHDPRRRGRGKRRSTESKRESPGRPVERSSTKTGAGHPPRESGSGTPALKRNTASDAGAPHPREPDAQGATRDRHPTAHDAPAGRSATGGTPGGTRAAAAPAPTVATSAPKCASGGPRHDTGGSNSLGTTPAPEPVSGAFLGRGVPGTVARTGRDSGRRRREGPERRHIPTAVRRYVWQRDGGRCCYRDSRSGRRCKSSQLLQIDHRRSVADGGGPEPDNLALLCFAHHRLRHGHRPSPTPEQRM